ncbi:MAG: metal-sensitive transcriptional regulator [Candidatus Omnitrophica bacterium]|nr:metal-sensitive transcriptional regulator [Candidatus Omnitrophota bacterium]
MKKYPTHEENIVALKRIEGQVRGIQRMIEEGKYCVDILTQVHAVMGALAKVEDKVLEKHLKTCVSKAVKGKSPKERQEKFNELMDLVQKFRKL